MKNYLTSDLDLENRRSLSGIQISEACNLIDLLKHIGQERPLRAAIEERIADLVLSAVFAIEFGAKNVYDGTHTRTYCQTILQVE
jgi:hypothetical protein